MKMFTAPALLAGSLAVASCGPGVPIELPEDSIQAARICFSAKGLVLREGKGQDDEVTYDEFVEAVKYPMIAASQKEPFSIDTVGAIFEGTEAVAEDVVNKDYEGVIADCDARFAGQPLKLPEKDNDAILSCTAMVGFVSGATGAKGAEFGGDPEAIDALMKRLEAAMEKNPDLLLSLIQGKPDEMMSAALQSGFAQGDVDGYVDKCQARFPAE